MSDFSGVSGDFRIAAGPIGIDADSAPERGIRRLRASGNFDDLRPLAVLFAGRLRDSWQTWRAALVGALPFHCLDAAHNLG